MSHQNLLLDLPEARVIAREFVVATLPGIAFASVAEAAKFLGIGVSTLRHSICGETGIAEIPLQDSDKTFPLPTRRLRDRRRRVIPVSGLIEFYARSLLADVGAKPSDLDEASDVALKDAVDDASPQKCNADKANALGAPRKAPKMPHPSQWRAMTPTSSPAAA